MGFCTPMRPRSPLKPSHRPCATRGRFHGPRNELGYTLVDFVLYITHAGFVREELNCNTRTHTRTRTHTHTHPPAQTHTHKHPATHTHAHRHTHPPTPAHTQHLHTRTPCVQVWQTVSTPADALCSTPVSHAWHMASTSAHALRRMPDCVFGTRQAHPLRLSVAHLSMRVAHGKHTRLRSPSCACVHAYPPSVSVICLSA